MKGHVRNRSAQSGGSAGSGPFLKGEFKPGHVRNESVLSKISRLSVRSFGKPICIKYRFSIKIVLFVVFKC